METAYSIIIPAYNEEATVEAAVRKTAEVFRSVGRPFEIIVVDDGSSDATAEVAEGLKQDFPALRLIRHEANRGKGPAVASGIGASSGERLLFLDCDLSTHPSEAPKFIAALEDADIVIGSRQAAGATIVARQPWHRIIYGRAINFFVRRLLGLKHHDTQCGFKMFRREAALAVFAGGGLTRWMFDVEMLLRAKSVGYRVVELPVAWRAHRLSRVKIREVLSDLWRLRKIARKVDSIRPRI